MLEWLHQNREWVFSGIGVSAIVPLIAVVRWAFLKRHRRSKARTAECEEMNQYLGQWNCTWTFAVPQGREPFIDSITFTNHDGYELSGTGDNPDIGLYIVKGRVFRHVLMVWFHGTNTKEDLKGVVLLKKEPLQNKLSGEWLQFIQTGQIAKGKTNWDKVLT